MYCRIWLSPVLVCYTAVVLWRSPTQTEFPTLISVNSYSGTAQKLSGREENTQGKKLFFQQMHRPPQSLWLCLHLVWSHPGTNSGGDTQTPPPCHVCPAYGSECRHRSYPVREPWTDHLWKSSLIAFWSFLSFRPLACAALSGREHHSFTMQHRTHGRGSSVSFNISLKNLWRFFIDEKQQLLFLCSHPYSWRTWSQPFQLFYFHLYLNSS